jgi:endoglucanase
MRILSRPVAHICLSVFFSVLFILPATRSAHAAGTLPFLHARGTQIVDPAGKPVLLRGINIGGWLVEEPWMEPFVTTPPPGSNLPPVRDHVSLWETMEKRLGRADMLSARTAFRNAWFNESDMVRIHDAGLNCIRLPFLASLADEPGGMTWLDRAIQWAGENHIYVILDMHGVPGGQSDQDHTGQAGVNMFFKTPADIKATEALWTRIARRYRDNPVVAGYDLINEPTGTPNSDTLYVVEDRLYRAVRAGDPDHLIFIEDGYTGIPWMPYPVPAGWTNVVYSWHSYQFNAKVPEDHISILQGDEAQIATVQQTRDVPFYIGEFGLEPNGNPQTLQAVIDGFDHLGLSWSMWTYKAIFPQGGQNLWALYENAQPLIPLNPYQDSLAQWIQKCAQLQTKNLTENAGIAAAFRQSAQTAY